MSRLPPPVGSDCHDSRCVCARCASIRVNARGLAAAEKEVLRAAEQWYGRGRIDFSDTTDVRLAEAVAHLREWRESSEKAQRRRAAARERVRPDLGTLAEGPDA